MADLRLRLTLQGPVATPMHSGTLFGHLCWIKRWRDGEDALADWLAAMAQRPLLISDALPADCLPRPLLAPMEPPRPAGGDRAAFVRRLQADRALLGTDYIRVTDFLDLRVRLNEAQLLDRLRSTGAAETGDGRVMPQARHPLHRLRATALEGDGRQVALECWPDAAAAGRDVYVRGGDADTEDLFRRLGEWGFGRAAGLGRGRFTVRAEPAEPRLFQHRGNRLLSLSHGVLTPNMLHPRYRLHAHYGKLGAGHDRPLSPHKRPLILTRPGATFEPADAGPYGALLAAVHPGTAPVRHHALHLCLPYTEADA
ncbi:MAG: hypothetical protein M3Z21_05120 [Pseudomonadota bacterium]|nr:hypothetical protein [Pseudomonadota bacterium]